MVGVSRASSELAPDNLYEYALRALGRRPHTSAELRAKLARRSTEEDVVEAVISRLRDNGYVDDELVAESHSEFRRDYALVGHKRVLDELRRRGVESSTAERVVEEAYEDADEAELARNFLRRKLGQDLAGVKINGRRDLNRLYGALARAGFEPHVIADVLREVSDDDQLLDALANVDVGG